MINYVCFNITSYCNMNCEFCYRVGSTYGSVNLPKAKKFIDMLSTLGCKTINITGGEPLLNSCWREIVEYCNSKEIYTILSTNGLLLDLQDPIMRKINVISLPLDGSDDSSNDSVRISGHFRKVSRLINDYKKGNYPFKLKVNTVITKHNITNVFKMLSLLDDSKIVWKLFGLREKGEFYHFSENNKVRCDEETAIINSLLQAKHSCSIIYMKGTSSVDLVGAVKPNYIVLNYNGDVYFSTDNEDILLFNLNDYQFNNDLDLKELNNQYFEELKNALQ